MAGTIHNSRTSPEGRLSALRDTWIAAENRRTEAYRAFMGANRMSPLRRELDEAEKAEDRAKRAYSRALQQQQKAITNGIDTRAEAADRD